MLRLTAAAVALVAIASPAMSQTSAPAGAAQATVPNAQNSGAGIPGQAGNQNGAAVRPPSTTSGANASSSSSDNEGIHEDAAKNPGLPGDESGPTTEPQPGAAGRDQ
jgi:hypothetical protein